MIIWCATGNKNTLESERTELYFFFFFFPRSFVFSVATAMFIIVTASACGTRCQDDSLGEQGDLTNTNNL